MRCVYLTNNTSLIGFTLTAGATLIYNGLGQDYGRVQSGGGVYCESGSSVSNCIVTNNCAYIGGGGASGGTLLNCALIGNQAVHGTGGGVTSATLNSCILSGNSALEGGGSAYGTANNCLLFGNSAVYEGGGADFGTLNNCTLVENLALESGGGASGAILNNCILYNNSAPSGTNYALGFGGGSLQYCCTTPLADGPGNFTNAPIFINEASGNFRLQTNSPCMNVGNNSLAPGPVDLDGRPRIAQGTVDTGAYEFQGAGMGEFTAWLRQFGLASDGSADSSDPDHDGMNNWQEWRSGTDPLDFASALRMSAPVVNSSGVLLKWQSISGVTYYLMRSTTLSPQPLFLDLQSNLVGNAGETTFVDTNPPTSSLTLYRVGVQ
jgi:hypothetical protein